MEEEKYVLIQVPTIVAAAIGHAMAFAVEEDPGEPEFRLLVDKELVAGAEAFYDKAKELAKIHPNSYDPEAWED